MENSFPGLFPEFLSSWMLARVEQKIQTSTLLIRYQRLTASKTEAKPIKLLLVKIKHTAKEFTGVVSR